MTAAQFVFIVLLVTATHVGAYVAGRRLREEYGDRRYHAGRKLGRLEGFFDGWEDAERKLRARENGARS